MTPTLRRSDGQIASVRRGHPIAAPVKWQTHAPAPQERTLLSIRIAPSRLHPPSSNSPRAWFSKHWLRRSAPVTHQDQGFGHSAVMRLACGPWRHSPPQKTLCSPACPIIASLVARAGLVAAGLWGAGARSYYFPQAAIYSNQIMLQRLPIKREQLSIE